MEPKIIHKEAFTLLGLPERFSHGKGDFEGIWKRFMRYLDQIQPFSTDDAFYGANTAAEDGKEMDYLAGMAVKGVQMVQAGLTLRDVPASRYAVFECTVKTIGETYVWILEQCEHK